MIQQAIQHIQEQTEQALRPKELKVPGDPGDVRRMIDKDGKVEIHRAEPHPRGLQTRELAELVALAKHYQTDKSAIYYNCQHVEFIFNTDDGRDRAVLPLVFSEEGRFLWSAYKNREATYSTSFMKNMLRYPLRRCFDDDRLLKQVASTGFGATDNMQQDGGRTGESLGKTITTSVEKPEDLPNERQIFNCRMWSNPEMPQRFPIEVVLDPDTQKREWIVWVMEESIGSFGARHLEALRGAISDIAQVVELEIPILGGSHIQGRG